MAFSLTGILCREMTACLQRHLVGQKAVILRRIRPVDLGYRVRFLEGSSGNDVKYFGELNSQSHRVGVSQNPNKLAKPTKDSFPFVTKDPINPARINGLKSKLKQSKGISNSTTSSFAKTLRKAPSLTATTQVFKEGSGSRKDPNILLNESLSNDIYPDSNVTEQDRTDCGKDDSMQLCSENTNTATLESMIIKGQTKPLEKNWRIFLESETDSGANKESSKKCGAPDKSCLRLENELANKDTIFLLDRSDLNEKHIKKEVKVTDSGDVPFDLSFVSRDSKTAASGGKMEQSVKTRQLLSDLQDVVDISADLRHSEVTSSSMSHFSEKAHITDDRMEDKMRTSDKNAKPDWPAYFDLYNNSLEQNVDDTQCWMPKAWLELEEQSGLSERQKSLCKDHDPMKGYKTPREINEEEFMVSVGGISNDLSSHTVPHRIKETAPRYDYEAHGTEHTPLQGEHMASEKGTKVAQNVKATEAVQRVDGKKSVPQPLLYVTQQDMAKGKPNERSDGESVEAFYREQDIVAQMADKLEGEIIAKNKLSKVEGALKSARIKKESIRFKDHLEVSPRDFCREKNIASIEKSSERGIKVPKHKSKNHSPLFKKKSERSSQEPLLCVTTQEIAKVNAPLKSRSMRTQDEETNKTEMNESVLNPEGKTEISPGKGLFTTQVNDETEKSSTALFNTNKDQIAITKKEDNDPMPSHWYLDYISLHEKETYITPMNKGKRRISKPSKEISEKKGVDSEQSAFDPSTANQNVSLGFVKHAPQLKPKSDDLKRSDCTTESPYIFVMDSLEQNPASQPLNELFCCNEQPMLLRGNQNHENCHPLPESHDQNNLSPVTTAVTGANSHTQPNCSTGNTKSSTQSQKSPTFGHPMEQISEDFLWLRKKINDPETRPQSPKLDIKTKFHRDILKTYVGEKVKGTAQSLSPSKDSSIETIPLTKSGSLHIKDVFTTSRAAQPHEKTLLKTDSLNARDILASVIEEQRKDVAKRKKEKKTKKKKQNEVNHAIKEEQMARLFSRISKSGLQSLDGLVTMTAKRMRQDDPSKKILHNVPLPYSYSLADASSIQSTKGDYCWPITQNGKTDDVVKSNNIFLNEQMKMTMARYHERSKKEKANRRERKDSGKREKSIKKKPKRDRKSQKFVKEPTSANF